MLSTIGRTAYLYQSSTFVQSQIPVAESTSECFISALWHTRLLLVSARYHHFNSLKDHVEQSSSEQSANSSELLRSPGISLCPVMRHPSSWESLDLLVFPRSTLG